MRRKRLLLVSPFYGEHNNAIPRRVMPIIDQFREENYSISIITSSDVEGTFKENIISTILKIPSNSSPLPVRALLELFWGLEVGLRILLRRKFREDIVVTVPSFFGFLVYTLFVPKQRGKIVDMRDAYPKLLGFSGFLNEKSHIYMLLVRYTNYLMNRYELSTTVSKGLLSEIVYGIGFGNSHIIYNGFDEHLIHIREPKYENYTVVMHGTLGGMQNVEFFVELVNSLIGYGIDFIVIGKGPKANLVKDLETVRYIEDMERGEMLKLISKCHLGLSLRREGWAAESALPVKVFEYHGLGLGFIAAPMSEVSDVFNEEYGCYNLDLEIDSIRERILNLSVLRESQEVYRLNSEFTRENQSIKFLNLYHELLDDRGC